MIDLPINGLGPDGTVVEISRPPGAVKVVDSRAAGVTLHDERFQPANLSVARGTKITWSFADSIGHNILLASGPRHVASTTLSKGGTYVKTLYEPGTYKLFCYLHPITMTQVIDVRP